MLKLSDPLRSVIGFGNMDQLFGLKKELATQLEVSELP
jgi:hypothetical protein